MSKPQIPKPVKLIIGFFLKDKDLLKSISVRLVEKFGSLDMVSKWFPFDMTDYYHSEMGTPLFRRIFAFNSLIRREDLAVIKLETNVLEREFMQRGSRTVNLDPGYLSREHFVLATGKNYTHRIYLGKGIYADLTLIYSKGAFQALPWTYPDYAQGPVVDFLQGVRAKYIFDLGGARFAENPIQAPP
ncbi:MAG: GTP-binding protein [Deltaproteobacteria bacterium RBG_13_49_15]|nr:MAG: GTP-binding protein [Deltaproteobacteria bacterium RBG_13_49_15]